MDCHMPVMDGFEATKEIVKIYSEDRPPILALTASVTVEDVKLCYEAGVNDIILKPLDEIRFSEAVHKALNLS